MIDLSRKSYIWSKTNRITHVLLIILFAVTYILSDDDYLRYHAIFAIVFGSVILFRIIWGVVGPKYSKFKDFNFNINDLKEYLSSPFEDVKTYIGHNPASSWAIVLIFFLSFLAIISGMLTYGTEQHHGVFAFLYSDSLKKSEIFQNIHEFIVNALIGVIIAHIAGALADKFIKGNDAIDSMINGYKYTKEKDVVQTNGFQKVVSVLGFILILAAFVYLLFNPDNIFTVDLKPFAN